MNARQKKKRAKQQLEAKKKKELLEKIEAESKREAERKKRSEAAKEAWKRRKEAERIKEEQHRKRSEAAKKAWETRRKNQQNQVLNTFLSYRELYTKIFYNDTITSSHPFYILYVLPVISSGDERFGYTVKELMDMVDNGDMDAKEILRRVKSSGWFN